MKVNSSAIALGASVLALATAAPAAASGLGELGQLPSTDAAVKVEAKVKLPLDVALAPPSAKAGAKGEATSRRSEVGLTGSARAEAGTPASHARIEQLTGLRSELPKRASSGHLTAFAKQRTRGELDGLRHAHASKRRGHHARSRAKRTLAPAERRWKAPSGHAKKSVPLRTIGREVGNPLQMSPAAWLVALFGGTCLAVSRLAGRRRSRG
jgi:hypothetical protein